VVEDCKCTNCGCGKTTMEEMVTMMDDQTLPFIQTNHEGYIIREFDANAAEHLFKWHRDDADREIITLNENDWRFQFDNEIPIPMNGTVFVREGEYHRLIKGTSPLTLKIIEK
tara:strand:- start:2411 stop:2749 length:339 start_codon:yes stop_codon:yes gene_type:complete